MSGIKPILTSFCLCLLIAVSVWGNDEHFENDGYQFVFHDLRDLLLVIHSDSCYFIHVKDSRSEETPVHSDQGKVQDYVVDLIRHHHGVKHSSLYEMRNKYQDLLADFHCLHKTIYSMDTDLDDMNDDDDDDRK